MAEVLEFEIRPSVPADLPAIERMMARAYPVLLRDAYPPSVLVTAIPILARVQPALLASGTWYIAEDGAGRVLGAGGWTPANPHGRRAPDRASVRHFATLPEAVRQGVGRSIFARSLTEARAAGVTGLDCMSTLAAVPFYAALGFEEIGRVEAALRPGIRFPAVQMQRGIS